MARSDVLSDVVTFALGGGLAAVVGATLKAYTSVRSGIRAGEKETIDNIVADRRAAREETEAVRAAAREEVAAAHKQTRIYERLMWRYHRQLIEGGVRPDPMYPMSELDGDVDDHAS